MADPVASLYLHVPFCARKCAYCALYSRPASTAQIDRYVEAVRREMDIIHEHLRPRTVYIGGGTPSLLSMRQWERLLRQFVFLDLCGPAEWTMEANPGALSMDLAKLWRDHGINRVSLGIQTLHDPLLQRLGRIHTRATAVQSFDLLRRVGFDNINVDLMFAIPGQTMQMWGATLTEALALDSEHLACYEVTYEEDTPLYEQMRARQFAVDENLACAMYEELIIRAELAGLHQYEVSNFAQNGPGNAALSPALEPADIPSRACLHNVNYWRGGSFGGIGPSATSYLRGVRSKNLADTAAYCEALEQGRSPVEDREELPPLARAGEIAAFGLRMTAGWPYGLFRQTTGFDLRQQWAGEIAQMIQLGYGQSDGHRFRLTPLGLRFADWVAEQFIRLPDNTD